MTVVIGCEHDGEVWLAADSYLSDEDSNIRTYGLPKAWKKGAFVFGHAGEIRFGQLLKYGFVTPELPKKITDETCNKYVTMELIPSIRALYKSEYKDHEHSDAEYSVITGFRGRL